MAVPVSALIVATYMQHRQMYHLDACLTALPFAGPLTETNSAEHCPTRGVRLQTFKHCMSFCSATFCDINTVCRLVIISQLLPSVLLAAVALANDTLTVVFDNGRILPCISCALLHPIGCIQSVAANQLHPIGCNM